MRKALRYLLKTRWSHADILGIVLMPMIMSWHFAILATFLWLFVCEALSKTDFVKGNADG